MMDTTIALAGAGGDLGGRIARALVAHGATVRALVRPGLNDAERSRIEALGVAPVAADPADVDAMATALVGAACVVSALNGLHDVMIDRQSVLLDAAVKAAVPRLISSGNHIQQARWRSPRKFALPAPSILISFRLIPTRITAQRSALCFPDCIALFSERRRSPGTIWCIGPWNVRATWGR